MYPEDSIQAAIGPESWWVKDPDSGIKRGSLVLAFVPYVDQIPYTIEPVGRRQPDQHHEATVKIGPLRTQKARRTSNLPVAAMPLHHGEVWTAYRAKKRPCLVLGCGGVAVDRNLVKGSPKRSTARMTMVAPYYGVDQSGNRAGYNPVFVERVRHGEYPQFFLDRLPLNGGPEESIMRLDQLQPIGTHHLSYEFTGHALGPEGMEVIDEYIRWLLFGGVSRNSLFALFREDIAGVFGPESN